MATRLCGVDLDPPCTHEAVYRVESGHPSRRHALTSSCPGHLPAVVDWAERIVLEPATVRRWVTDIERTTP